MITCKEFGGQAPRRGGAVGHGVEIAARISGKVLAPGVHDPVEVHPHEILSAHPEGEEVLGAPACEERWQLVLRLSEQRLVHYVSIGGGR